MGPDHVSDLLQRRERTEENRQVTDLPIGRAIDDVEPLGSLTVPGGLERTSPSTISPVSLNGGSSCVSTPEQERVGVLPLQRRVVDRDPVS